MALFLAAAAQVLADEGSGRAKLGYTFLDDNGNRAAFQETHNLYEGAAFSLKNFFYLMDNGLRVSADLNHVAREDRNSRLSLAKAKQFSLSLYNSRYRRIYEPMGLNATRRDLWGGRLSITPVEQLKLYAAFDRIDKKGETWTAYDPTDPTIVASDFNRRTVTVGAQASHFGGTILLEYKGYGFQDYLRDDRDRKGNEVKLRGTLPIPSYDRLVVSGGYGYREDQVNGPDVKLYTHLPWGAAKLYLPEQFLLDYRFVYGYTYHNITDRGTENVFNTVAVTKSWNKTGGLRVGYDNRWSSDKINRRKSNGFLFNAWYNYAGRLFLRALGGMRNDKDDKSSTLIGDEDYTRYQLTAKYRDDRFGAVSAKYQGRDRKREDLGTRIDYDMFAAEYSIDKDKLGRLILSYAYYLGKFENLDGSTAFSDYVVTARIVPVSYKKATLSLGGVYYRSKRDLNIEKYSVDIGLEYMLPRDFGIEARYSRFDYRDFQLANDEYDSNYIEVYLLKDFSL
jgi:hypothetical protein